VLTVKTPLPVARSSEEAVAMAAGTDTERSSSKQQDLWKTNSSRVAAMNEPIPEPAMDDLPIANEAMELEPHIHSRLAELVREFQLVVLEKGLVLRGQANTYYAKHLAQLTLMEAGLPILANEIEVR
jgi:hypothetical protein